MHKDCVVSNKTCRLSDRYKLYVGVCRPTGSYAETRSSYLTQTVLPYVRYDTYYGGSTRFGDVTKIHNSVIWLIGVMFDSKITTSISESTKGYKIVWGQYFPLISKSAPWNWANFSDFASTGQQKHPYISTRRQNFQTSNVHFQFCV